LYSEKESKYMKIAILGTRGIPNYYGGFEQFAEYFSVYLAQKGHEVYCYNSHNHKYQEPIFNGVHIIHKHDPEYKFGTFGQFIYDYNCIVDSRKRSFDVILQLGYTSNSIWFFLLPKKSKIITNMDGLEWKRSKYSWPVQQFLKFAEWLAAKSSDYLVADSLGIQDFLKKTYKKESTYIAYGTYPFYDPNIEVLQKYQVTPYQYNMVMARFEPENNIETVLDGVVLAKSTTIILVVGNHQTKYGDYLKSKFKNYKNIIFTGGIYNLDDLNNLRYYSNIYFHGHSVGGTNPSLLEAMASKAFIIAHKNPFNAAILKENAFYFSNAEDIKNHLSTKNKKDYLDIVEQNFKVICKEFTWNNINEAYLKLIEQSVQ